MSSAACQTLQLLTVLFLLIVLFYVLFVSIVLFYELLMCKCVLYYCHRESTQIYHIIFFHIIS